MASSKFTKITCVSLVLLSIFSSFSLISAFSRQKSIVDFVNSCEDLEPSTYYGSPGEIDGTVVTLENTFQALEILKLISDEVVAEGSVISYLSDLRKEPEGGFESYGGAEDYSVSNIYIAAKIINDVDPSDDLSIHVTFINNSYDNITTYGFGPNPDLKEETNLISTYHAIKTLELTGNLSLVNLTRVHQFVNSCKLGNYMYASSPDSNTTSLVATAYALSLYDSVLAAFDQGIFDGPAPSAVLNYLNGINDPEGGFFDDSINNEPTLFASYFAVRINNLIADTEIAGGKKNLEDWILSKQNFDGGFVEGESPPASSSISATYYAIETLYLLDSSLNVLEQQSPYYLEQIGGIIAAIIFIAIIVVVLIAAYYFKKKNQI